LHPADRGRQLGAVARSSPRLGMQQAAGERNTPDARRYNTDTPEPASCHGRKTSRQAPVRLLTDARISIEPQIMVAGKMHHGPLGQRGNGEPRIDANRARNHRAVADIKAGMRGFFAPAVEYLAFVVDHALTRSLPHAATANRVLGGARAAHGD